MKRRLITTIASLILLTSALVLQFARNYPIACNTYAEVGIKGVISYEINKTLSEKLNNNQIKYSEIAMINTQNDGSISSITVDTSKINIIALELSSEIYNAIANANNNFSIPLGNAMGSRIFSGSGPNINIKILPVGSSVFDIKSEVLSSGINQTLHRMSIFFSTEIKCTAPFHEYTGCIETKIVLSETLIIGKIPEIILQR